MLEGMTRQTMPIPMPEQLVLDHALLHVLFCFMLLHANHQAS